MNSKSAVLIGFGSQGIAWALNLRDSGWNISVALRANSSSIEKAKSLDFQVVDFSKLGQFSNILLLIPDHEHKNFLDTNQNFIMPLTNIIYAHGHSYVSQDLAKFYPQFNHLLLAPKAIASEVRFQFQSKGKIGAVYSLEGLSSDNEQIENSKSFLFQLAKDLGITGGPYPTSFSNEATADLFSEQTLLCGLIPFAAKQSYDLLIENGIEPEIAYMECWVEIKLICDALVKMGPESFFQLISPNALIGAQKARQIFFDKEYQNKLKTLLREIKNGDFDHYASKVDISIIRDEILSDWKSSSLSDVHQRISKDVISK